MNDSANRDPGDAWPWSQLLGAGTDSLIPIPWARSAGMRRVSIKDGGSYPVAPPGYTEAFGRGAQYSAFRVGTTLFITTSGTLGNLNQYADIRQAPIRIYPPAFDFLVYTPPITLPTIRPFNFTVMVGYPAGPKTVVIRDAEGSHQVEIGEGHASMKALSGFLDGVTPPNQAFGMGESIEEAVEVAIASMPVEVPSHPDAMYTYKVMESGKMVGGFAGLNTFYVSVTRAAS